MSITKFTIAEDCVPCILNMCLNGMRIAKFSNTVIREVFKDSLKNIFSKNFIWDYTSAEIVEFVLNEITRKTNKKDIFYEVKQISNSKLLNIYKKLKESIYSSDDSPLLNAIKLSIVGNTIDVMVSKELSLYDIESLLKSKISSLDVDLKMFKKLYNKLKNSKSLLIIGDNSGEAVLDKLLIEVLKDTFDLKIFYATRNEPALNDITYSEALEIGINNICKVISNGVKGQLPGTVLSRCSKEFLDIFYSVDLIISKGGGNFETLLNERKLPENTFFLLICKCNVHSSIFSLSIGKGVIWQRSL